MAHLVKWVTNKLNLGKWHNNLVGDYRNLILKYRRKQRSGFT